MSGAGVLRSIRKRRRPAMPDKSGSRPSGFDRRAFMAGAAGSALVPMTARAAAQGANTSAAQDPTLPVDVTLRVNGQDKRLRIDARTTVLDALREHLGLTGSKKGCDHGQCGACTVLIGDRRVVSCLAQALSAAATANDPLTQATAQPLAGGTTLIDLMKLDVMRPTAIVDINPLARGWSAIEPGGESLRLGALAKMSDVAAHDDIQRNYP